MEGASHFVVSGAMVMSMTVLLVSKHGHDQKEEDHQDAGYGETNGHCVYVCVCMCVCVCVRACVCEQQ